MISYSNLFYMDKKTGNHYVKLTSLNYSFPNNTFQIPDPERVWCWIDLSKKHALAMLRGMDKEQHVMVERKPGMGFEPVLPANPTYDQGRLTALRTLVERSICVSSGFGIIVDWTIGEHPDTITARLLIEGLYSPETNYIDLIPITVAEELTHDKTNKSSYFVFYDPNKGKK